MITLNHVYILEGAMFAAFAWLSIRDRTVKKRFGNGAFWGLLAVSYLLGDRLGDLGNGILVLALIVIGGFEFLGRSAPQTTAPEHRARSASRWGNALFVPALVIPVVTMLGTLFFQYLKIHGVPLIDPKQTTLIALAIAALTALIVALLWIRPPASAAMQEGRRLIDAVGWASVLPQLLASLGAVFAFSHVGDAVGEIATRYVPLNTPLEAVIVYCIGMAVFTAIMGNAFAAFPVMTAAIGLPLVVHKFGGNVAIMGAIGMLCGYCGTLTTPMAANFNIVPAALLELPDRNGVIRAQIPTAIPLLAANIALMYFLVFRF